jgi:hypothetical protein
MSRDVTPGFTLPGMDPDLAGEDAAEPGPGRADDVVPGLRPEPEPGTGTGQPGTGPAGSGNQRRNHRDGSGTGRQNQAGGPAAGAPERISVVESAWLAVLAWARRAAHNHKRHRSFGHWVWNALFNTPPDTLVQYARYIRSNAWLKDYMTGWLRTAATWEYRIFAVLIGGPLVQAGNSISRTGARQSRFWLTLAVALLALAIWLLRH